MHGVYIGVGEAPDTCAVSSAASLNGLCISSPLGLVLYMYLHGTSP